MLLQDPILEEAEEEAEAETEEAASQQSLYIQPPLPRRTLPRRTLLRRRTVSITVPDGVEPGKAFQMRFENLILRMVCPPDAAAGQTLKVQIPASSPSSIGAVSSQSQARHPANAQACTNCHQQKRKCDLSLKPAGEPCRRCEMKGLRCVPHLKAKAGRRKKIRCDLLAHTA